MSDEDSTSVAEHYRTQLHEAWGRIDDLERRLSRRSIDDVYLLLIAVLVLTVGFLVVMS